MSNAYPDTRRGDHVDVYRNRQGEEVRVPDPYRWLEDPDAPETREWVEAQNRVSDAVLGELPARQAYIQRLTQLWDYARPGTPWRRGRRYFRQFNPGLLNQPKLQVSDSPRGPWTDLLDPNSLSEDGTVALMGLGISKDGGRLAYGTQSAGSDWVTWRVRDVDSAQDTDDRIEWSKFSGAQWLPDGSGFYYAAYDAPQGGTLTGTNRNQRLMLHRVGTPQSEDQLILARPDEPDWGFHAHITEDDRYLIVDVWKGTARMNQVWVRELGSDGPFIELVNDFRASFTVLGNDGDTLYLLTDEDAALSKIISWNVKTGEQQTIIPEGTDKIDFATLVQGGLLLVTLKDASHRVTLHNRHGARQRDLALPALGSVMGFSAHQDDTEVFIGFTSYLFPTTPYRAELPGGELEALEQPSINLDVDEFEVTQDFAISKDGTRVPHFIIARRGLKRDGTNPTLLYGYGGFNASMTPAFSPAILGWLDRGGVYVATNLRGGGEYGKEWHAAGTLNRKQNVFDDFIAVAEHLIETGLTSPAHLGIQGRSNGGLLVGAAMTQRPELFAAAIPQVGVMDMLRYHEFTIGWAWASDYGRSDDPEMFSTLHAYSPLHNLEEGVQYPATLVTTGDHDDRVVPAHSYKFMSELQRVQRASPGLSPSHSPGHQHNQHRPTIIRIQVNTGHGAGKPTALLIEEWADVWSFLENHLK
ncbi:S9 family peptidase [Deinococcus cavernae]|uniref:prolyl oligopeptidase n=1 Tax=Deinococcus cavernae TaxID=2320857 RepID=A0A418V8M3_9DEIO|nr:prolyl oligopeptidase family serine peptidase [Deinococcus cavernae]RJF72444.1 S9 family peptidase [Deinococcus cavernae]